jgi:hypothetical protein
MQKLYFMSLFKLLPSLLLAIAAQTTLCAQMLTNEGTLFISNDTPVSIEGGLLNKTGATLTNSAEMYVKGDFTNDGTYISNSIDTILLNGTGLQNFKLNSNVSNLQFIGAGPYQFTSPANVTQLVRFGSGIANTTETNVLRIALGADFSGAGPSSHVNGAVSRVGGAGALDYPFGNGTNYIPATLTFGTSTTNGEVKITQFHTASGGTSTCPFNVISPNRYYKVAYVSGTIDQASLKLMTDFDGVTPGSINDMRIAKSATQTGEYIPIPNLSVSGTPASGTVACVPQTSIGSSTEYYLLGAYDARKVQLKVFLEGPYNTTTNIMNTGITSYLTGIYGSAGSGGPAAGYTGLPNRPTTVKMTSGNPPAGAVDVVTIELRTGTTAGTATDTMLAWLMNDGTLRDFETGTMSFIQFCDAVSGNYHVLVRHRNHLPTISKNPVAVSGAVPGSPLIDLSINTNNLSDRLKLLEPGVWGMYAGDVRAIGTAINRINSADFFQVRKISSGTPTGFILEDLNLDGVCNSADYNLCSYNNDFLYISNVTD